MELNKEQIAHFHELGYLILPSVFRAAEIKQMAAKGDRILELCLNTSLALGEQDDRLRVQVRDGKLNVQKVQPINDLSSFRKAISENERLVGPLRQLMGGYEPILMEEKLNYKELIHQTMALKPFAAASEEDSFPLHHDWGYYRQQGYPGETLSSAVSIDATTPNNGPIRVIPGTHKQDWPLLDPDPASGRGEVAENLFPLAVRIQVIAPAGSVMLFHAKLIHDSSPNNTGLPRRLMIYSHYPNYHQAEPDQRNRKSRSIGQQQEERYRQLVATNQYQDQLKLPVQAVS